jgi:CBS domain-containing protein
MSSPVHACRPGDTVSYARNLMLKHHISRILVMDNNHVAGIITKKDIGYRLRGHDPAWRRRAGGHEPVSGLMTKDILSMSPDSSIRDALTFMTTHNISGFPVLDKGFVLGIVTRSDMLRSPLITGIDKPITEVMHDVPTVTIRHSLDHVIDQMKAGCGKVVVTGDDGSNIGLISESDLTFSHEGRDLTDTSTAGDIMRSPLVTLPITARVRDAVAEMGTRHISSIIVTSEEGMKGIITRDDIIGEVVQ